MQVEPQITFHDIDHSDWVTTYVSERLARIDQMARGITSCRVTISREQRRRRTANRYGVMVEVRLPPAHDLAVKKQLDVRDMSADLPLLINRAFGALEKQVRKTASLRRGDALRAGSEPRGIVEKLFPEGFGFIRAVGDTRDYYFHRNSVLHGDYERLTVGTEVRFSPGEGEQGLQASSVQIVNKPGRTPSAR